MKILFIGDIFGKTGISAISKVLQKIKDENKIDFVIANGENTTNCRSLSSTDYLLLNKYGIDFFTMGNHTWNNDDIYNLLVTKMNIIRPYNINFQHKFSQYGSGSKIVKINNFKVRITNLIGNSIRFNNIQTNPFVSLQEIINFDQSESYLVQVLITSFIFILLIFIVKALARKMLYFLNLKEKYRQLLEHTHIFKQLTIE